MQEYNKTYDRMELAAMLTPKIDKLKEELSKLNMYVYMQQLLAQTKPDMPLLNKTVTPENLAIPKRNIVRDERRERKKQNTKRRERLHSSDEQRCKHFVKKQKQYDAEVDDKLLELEEWYDDIDCFEHRTPNVQDFASMSDKLSNDLKELAPRFKSNDLFKDGPEDTALCGRLLIKMEDDWDENEEQEAVCLMSALQWLVRKKNELASTTMTNQAETIPTPPPSAIKEEDAETAELLKLLTNSRINIEKDQPSITLDGKCYSQGQTLIAIMQKYQDEGKEWAKNPNQFSQKIVLGEAESTELTPEQKKKADTISKRMRRAKNVIGNARLKDLSAESIQNATDSLLRSAQMEYEKWNGLYSSVQKILDTVRTDQSDKNGQERTETNRTGQILNE